MSSVVEIDDTDSDQTRESVAQDRPKLRTRRAISYATVVDEESTSLETLSAGGRKRKLKIESDAEEDEPSEVDDDDEDDLVDEGNLTPNEPEEDANHRRSSRARKTVAQLNDFFDDDDYEPITTKRNRPKTHSKQKHSRASTVKNKSKSSKASKPKQSSDSESEFSDDGSVVEVQSGSEDENAFVIDKILAREVRTVKAWNKMCAHKETRFLTNGSIFLEDEDDDIEQKKPDGKSADVNGEIVTSDADTEMADPAANGEPTDAMDKGESAAAVGISDTKEIQGPKSRPTTVDQEKRLAQEEERFLIKWKNISHLHCSWEKEQSLLEVDKNAKGKIQRFREKQLVGLYYENLEGGDEYFSPEFCIVDRILDIQDRPGDNFGPSDEDFVKKFRYFLVKWKGLPYDQLTWEREDDVHDDDAVRLYDERLISAAKRYKQVHNFKNSQSRKKNRRMNFKGYTAASPPPFKKEQQFVLREYQLTGVNWMLFNWYQGRNSMLADEMGLGKTVQTVTFINHLAVQEHLPGPYLIIAPLSTLAHWQREFTNWTNLNAIVYHGSASARCEIQRYEFFITEEELARSEKLLGSKNTSTQRPKKGVNSYRFDVMITTPEMCCAADFSVLARLKWQVAVVDEAHRLKNRSSKMSNILHTKFSYENLLLLTGTPLQNNVEELWTLLNFLDQDRFHSMQDFLDSYGELKDSSQVERLHSELKPFLLRRMKEDVETSLAPKEETIIEVELTVLQKQYYRAIYEQNTEFLSRGRKKAQAPSLMNVVMELRKCCNHPFLIKGMEEREVQRLQQQKAESKESIAREVSELLVTSSGKLILLDKLLPPLKENGHRVLIFSQFKIMLDILQDYLRLRSYHCERIDGGITGNDRQSAIDRFCDANSASFVMLLSTRAGGVGINLTAADTVIIYDSDWNPQNDLQAQARCHRIGQKKSVKIYRLLTSKTYELHMFHQASMKLGLDQAVLGGIRNQNAALTKGKRGASSAPVSMSKDEIENLLKHGAYEMFKEEKEGEAEAASKRFSEESIDQILSRSTKIIHDPKANAVDENGGKKSLMSSFSKATFVSSTNPDDQVAIDDPDFWTKVIGLNGVEQDKPIEPSPLKKRRCRRQVKTYAQQYDSGEEAKKARSRKIKPSVQQKKDEEEFVISDSSDEDEEESDDLDDDDFMGGVKKKKTHSIQLPPIVVYKDRISDRLTTFGYGRWEDLTSGHPLLQHYPLTELKSFVAEYVASCVRVAASSAITSALMKANPSAVASSTSTLPSVATHDIIEDTVDKFASRYRFLSLVTQDRLVRKLSLISIRGGLPRNADSLRSERDAIVKLTQMERMYRVRQAIRMFISPAPPMVSLINELQKIGDRSAIQYIIESGKLPDVEATSPPENAQEKEDASTVSDKLTTVAESQTSSHPVEDLKLITESTSEPKNISENGPEPVGLNLPTSLTPTEPVASDTPNGPSISASTIEVVSSVASELPVSSPPPTSKPVEPIGSSVPTTSSAADSVYSGLTSALAPITKLAAKMVLHLQNISTGADSVSSGLTSTSSTITEPPAQIGSSILATSSAVDPVSPGLTSTSAPITDPAPQVALHSSTSSTAAYSVSSGSRSTLAAITEPPTQIASSVLATSSAADPVSPGLSSTSAPITDSVAQIAQPCTDEPVATTTPVVPPSSPSANDSTCKYDLVKKRIERKTALDKLRVIPDIGMAASVAPWWISVVDDVILLLYVFKDGWMKGRNLPSELVDYSSLFGSRALQHPHNTWPSVAILNKRVSSLLSAWTHQRKLKQAAQKSAKDATPQNGVPQQVVSQSVSRQSSPAPALAQSMVKPTYVGKSSYDVIATSKHNRFAKLVFMCGIPDIRICRDDRERREKWRYFLEDKDLAISNCSCDQLRAEAMDLELSCRVRLNRKMDEKPAQSTEMSILGGFRGSWVLTSTQCRRLLHRIHLFRTLRSEILVLPPSKLTNVVSRIVRVLRADSVNEFPQWWNSPRHDILLLQAVECYGFDEHLVMVWSLPLFAAANSLLPFPNTMWVENYVSLLAESCRKFVQRVKQQELEQRQHESQLVEEKVVKEKLASVDAVANPVSDSVNEIAYPVSDPVLNHVEQTVTDSLNEAKGDVVDGEGPTATSSDLPTAEAEESYWAQVEDKKHDKAAKHEDGLLLVEDVSMETHSSPVSSILVEDTANTAPVVVQDTSQKESAVQVQVDEDNAAAKNSAEAEKKAALLDHPAAGSLLTEPETNAVKAPSSETITPSKLSKKTPAAVSEEIVILSDDDTDQVTTSDPPIDVKSSSEAVETEEPAVAKEAQEKPKEAQPRANDSPKNQELKNSVQSVEVPKTKPDSALKRKRPIKSWEVITIDDSDDEDVAAKRLTRSRRRQL